MTYTLDFALSLGSGKAGLADLRAQLVDTGGASVGAAVSTGFVEIGAGNYLWHYAAIPDSHRGGVKFYSNATPATVLAFGALNPEEAENVDAKISTELDVLKGAGWTFETLKAIYEAIKPGGGGLSIGDGLTQHVSVMIGTRALHGVAVADAPVGAVAVEDAPPYRVTVGG